jgi:hypothetical protein
MKGSKLFLAPILKWNNNVIKTQLWREDYLHTAAALDVFFFLSLFGKLFLSNNKVMKLWEESELRRDSWSLMRIAVVSI